MSRDFFTLILEKAEQITPAVRHFQLRRQDGQAMEYTAGQFITIHFEHQDKTLRRSYSIANPPGQTGVLEFAAAHFAGGPGTEFLFNLQAGDPVQTTGPFGRLTLRDEQAKRLLLVATGTGVTPYRSMLPSLHQRLQAQPQLEVHILLGVQHRQDALYAEEFIAFAKQHERAHFYACYSREETIDEKQHPHERTGYVQNTLAELSPDPEGDVVYLCGNPAMVDEVFAQLKDAQFDAKNVRREKYIS